MRYLGYFVIVATLSSAFTNLAAWGTQAKPSPADKGTSNTASRGPSSLQAIAPKHALSPSGAAQALLDQKPLQSSSYNRAEKTSDRKIGPRVELMQVRTMPQIGTLHPAFRYSDVAVKFH